MSNVELPPKPCIVYVGTFEGISASISIDSGYKANIVLQEFVSIKREQLQKKIGSVHAIISHSQAGLEENVSKTIEHGLLLMADGTSSYKSNRLVGCAQYDATIGTPWHMECPPPIDNHQRIVKLKKGTETVELHENKTILNVDNRPKTRGKSISAKGFCSTQKKKRIVEIYSVKVQNLRGRKSQRKIESATRKLNVSDELMPRASFGKLLKEHRQNHKLVKMLDEHRCIFHSKLPPGLPPSKDAHH